MYVCMYVCMVVLDVRSACIIFFSLLIVVMDFFFFVRVKSFAEAFILQEYPTTLLVFH